MNEIKKEIENTKNKEVLIFTKRGFRYEGKVKSIDSDFLTLFDYRIHSDKLISITEISEITIKGEK